ncbi:unnamed protein product [Mytilus coruscus]|uniref:Uncharacterized protein n=1 Tax=Mytilus coruscus TaxID=42192 RepID=A0A6J8ENH6_MYTCO|nr:unnamed protein product [Mytilus coruscus]
MAVNYENRYQLSELKNIYTLPSAPYKKAQKTNNKMLIPFEKIDLTLCRKAAYCTVFITSRERMHFWLHALGQLLVIGNKNNPSVKVEWHDSTTQGLIERTEFEVHSSESVGDYEGDTLMYKVIACVPDHRILSDSAKVINLRRKHGKHVIGNSKCTFVYKKNFETLLSMNLQGLRNDIVQDVIKLLNKVETSPESIETLKQVHARELKMLREKMQESDIDKKKIIENFEIEKCQLMSKAKELERNSYQTKEVFQAAEEKLQNKIIVLTEKKLN